MKTLKEILPYYLNTGLKCTYKLSDVINIDNDKDEFRTKDLTSDSLTFCMLYCKPNLRTFNSLTKPITVEGYNGGKPFVPLYHLMKEDRGFTKDFIDCYGYEMLRFSCLQLLLKWHFNVFDIPTDQFIDIKD